MNVIIITASALSSVVGLLFFYEALYLGRFLQGITFGIGITAVPIYVADIVPRKSVPVGIASCVATGGC